MCHETRTHQHTHTRWPYGVRKKRGQILSAYAPDERAKTRSLFALKHAITSILASGPENWPAICFRLQSLDCLQPEKSIHHNSAFHLNSLGQHDQREISISSIGFMCGEFITGKKSADTQRCDGRRRVEREGNTQTHTHTKRVRAQSFSFLSELLLSGQTKKKLIEK